jgi:hypothetical protein
MQIILFFLKFIIGWALVIIGSVATLVPIPVVPFFLIILLGLHILGYDKKLLPLFQKIKSKFKQTPKNK